MVAAEKAKCKKTNKMINTNKYFSIKEIMVNDEKTVDLPTAESEVQAQQVFAICKFDGLSDILPKQSSVTWQQFCAEFSSHKQVPEKTDAACWSSSTYKAGDKRGNKNVVAISMAVIDVDNGLPVEILIKQIEGYAYHIHSSFSHTLTNPKYRVILPLGQPIEAAEWNQTWLRINAWVGGINDPSTKDVGRIYFMPACPLHSKDKFVFTGEGKLLNISDFAKGLI